MNFIGIRMPTRAISNLVKAMAIWSTSTATSMTNISRHGLTAEYYCRRSTPCSSSIPCLRADDPSRKLVDPSKISRVALMTWKARKTISPVLGKPKRRTQYAARFPTIVASLCAKRVLTLRSLNGIPIQIGNRATHLRFQLLAANTKPSYAQRRNKRR